MDAGTDEEDDKTSDLSNEKGVSLSPHQMDDEDVIRSDEDVDAIKDFFKTEEDVESFIRFRRSKWPRFVLVDILCLWLT